MTIHNDDRMTLNTLKNYLELKISIQNLQYWQYIKNTDSIITNSIKSDEHSEQNVHIFKNFLPSKQNHVHSATMFS